MTDQLARWQKLMDDLELAKKIKEIPVAIPTEWISGAWERYAKMPFWWKILYHLGLVTKYRGARIVGKRRFWRGIDRDG